MRKNHYTIAIGIAALLFAIPFVIFLWPAGQKAVASTEPARIDRLEKRIDELTAAVEKLASKSPQQAENKALRPTESSAAKASVESPRPRGAAVVETPPKGAGNFASVAPSLLPTRPFSSLGSALTSSPGLQPAMTAPLTANPDADMKSEDSATAGVETPDMTPSGRIASAAATGPANKAAPKKMAAQGEKDTGSPANDLATKPQTNKGIDTAKDEGQLGAVLTALNPGKKGQPKPDFEVVVMRPGGPHVRQSENVVLATKHAGWPVVVVRSEIDGDRWWVQQLVTRQGAYIASQTKFGNEQTVPGLKFEMVLLLLDSVEESVRFRTARQFEELPDGIRRSQPIHFIRN